MRMTTRPLRAQSSINAIQRALRDGLDVGLYGRLIQNCTDRLLDLPARQLHARLVLFSVLPDNFLASKLIAFYSKTNRLFLARHVFDKIPHRTTFSWNAMLIALSVHGLHRDVLDLFASMVSGEQRGSGDDSRADNFSVTCVMKALNEVFPDDPNLVREVHSYVLRNGFVDSDVFVANSLVTCYARCRKVGSARALFDRIGMRDVVSWNSMLSAYSQSGFYDECKALYKDMLGSEEVKPNSGTLVNVIQACGQSKDLPFGIEVHRYLSENQIQGTLVLYNALVGFYAKCGSLDYALELFEWMKEKDEVTYRSILSGFMAHGLVEKAMELYGKIRNPKTIAWNAAISGLVQNGYYEKALDLFRAMVKTENKPNVVTLSSILPAISHFSYLKGAKEIHAYAYRNRFEHSVFITTAVIDAYAKSGFLIGAQSVFDQSKTNCKNVVVWTAIISAYAVHGNAYKSIRLFEQMVNEEIRPDEVTFTALLTSCARFGVVNEARKIFKSMLPYYGIKPSIEHYTCMVNVASRAKKLSSAVKIIKEMPFEPNAKIWGALLNGASIAGKVKFGKLAFDRLIEIEPENTGNYVIMANLYSQAKRFNKANEIRERMNNIGLKKIAGSSWIVDGDSQIVD